MSYTLTKLLPLPFYPVGMTVLLLLFGLLLLLFRRKNAGIFFTFLALVVLTVSSMPYTSYQLVRSLERKYSPPEKLPRASAIVLLGGAGVPAVPPRIHPETSGAADRIMHAARLFHRGRTGLLIASGGPYAYAEGSEAEVNADLLTELFGVPRKGIVIEKQSRNTRDHAPNVRAILEEKVLPLDVILVTSAMHMHRAVKVFEKEGFKVTPAPTDYLANENAGFGVMSFVPQAGSLGGTTNALHEYYGFVVYRIFDWI